MAISAPSLSDACYLTPSELQEWATQLILERRHGGTCPELSLSAAIALQHPDSGGLRAATLSQLKKLAHVTIVENGPSRLPGECLIATSQVRRRVECVIEPEPTPALAPHIPGFPRSSRVWDAATHTAGPRRGRRG